MPFGALGLLIERRSLVVGTHIIFSGARGFKSRHGDRLFRLRFIVVYLRPCGQVDLQIRPRPASFDILFNSAALSR
jgi:hypothetical protein